MKQKYDEYDFPADPEMKRLVLHLSDLAAFFRGALGTGRENEFVQEYHATLETLYQLGWDDTLSWEDELPKDLMPEKYLRRNPSTPVNLEESRRRWLPASEFYKDKKK